MNTSRATAAVAVPITAFAVVYASRAAVAGWEPSWGWLFQAVIHIGELLAVVALAASGAAGGSRAARVGLAAAVAGQALLAAADPLRRTYGPATI
ncbi:hypothetical protein [Virgisporangium ochraceum]|uniref:Uncharacterized protein n=1 Tax=Virgisporangium ochraceum TaxID=65505 RepID=A0A8J4EGS2_9ACTN|nr:hypothetical protein [Virgisporangium ochraceum]GIJ71442.1 hypothetical protein Voc01_063590 [Virgisporangium ochraceum]